MANLSQDPAGHELDLSTLSFPDSARMPAFSLTMAWWAVCSAVFYIVGGAALAVQYVTRNALIVVCYRVPLVFGSVQYWVDKFNGVLLPFYLLGLLAAVVLTTHEYGYNAAWLDFGPKGTIPANGWWNCFVYYMGVWILMMFTFDYARFGRQKDAAYHGRFNFGMPFYLVTFLLNGAVGVYLVSTIPGLGPLSEVSVVLALLKLMGIWGLLFVWVTQSRINTSYYYLAEINMQAFFREVTDLHAQRFVYA